MTANKSGMEFRRCEITKKEITREVAVKWIIEGIAINTVDIEEQLNEVLSKIYIENK